MASPMGKKTNKAKSWQSALTWKLACLVSLQVERQQRVQGCNPIPASRRGRQPEMRKRDLTTHAEEARDRNSKHGKQPDLPFPERCKS